MNHLKKKGRSQGITDPDLLWNYVVIHSLYDERRFTHRKDFLDEMGIKFPAFGPAVKFNPNDANDSVLRAGNFGLLLLKDNYFKIVKANKNGK